MKKYIYGYPSLVAREGLLWKLTGEEADVTEDENFDATNSLWDHLEKKYRVGSGSWDDCFLRGTFLGERSQVLEIVYPPIINTALLIYLHEWLTRDNNSWRIIIPTFLSHRDALVIYANRVIYGSLICEEKNSDLLASIANRMLLLELYQHTHARAVEDDALPRPANKTSQPTGDSNK